LVEAVRPKRDYEVYTYPDGEVRISRTFDGVKYNIRFVGGSNLSFIMADGHPLSFNLDTDKDKNYPHDKAAGGEKCGTPDHLIERNVSRMIEDLPLDARQKAELKGYVAVLTFGPPSDLQGLKKVYVDTGADLESRKHIIRELNKPELGLTLLDGPDGAEIILDFGSRTEDHFEKAGYYPDTSSNTEVRYRQILIRAGPGVRGQRRQAPERDVVREHEKHVLGARPGDELRARLPQTLQEGERDQVTVA
jgi:hypothetical protein